ncbi:MAG TPA: MIP/aquaporin family protein [Casimicrobiaceae bacterium]|nr:MIP/aquaporin family protein [Casimicrobiaceae bacterium]
MNPAYRASFAEFVGTAGLLAVVVGSGIMGERLANGNAALALLANSIATGLALPVLIVTFAELSGSHFNPLISLVAWWRGELASLRFIVYVAAQFGGALAGVALAHVMFDLTAFSSSEQARQGFGQWTSEAVATFGLVFLVFATSDRSKPTLPFLVGAYIAAAYWFTASTSFANPAVTVARAFTDTFAGIRAIDVTGFVAAQIAGAILALIALRLVGR